MTLASHQCELTSRLAVIAGVSLLALACLLGGCQKAVSGVQAAAPATTDGKERADDRAAEKPQEGVSLKPDEVEKMGIVTTAARQITSAPEVSGFAVIVPHDMVAQAVAELHTAVAAEHQSRAAFERAHRLSGTPGAMPADTQETAERQAVADRAALELARQRLTTTLGPSLPWKNPDNSPELLELASGRAKLVRATFPLGSLGAATPTQLRLAEIDTGPGSRSWPATRVWRAPADVTVPGKSYFAILKGSDVGEGEHLIAWAPVGAAQSGVLVPAAAVLISGGKYWCYVEEKTGTFVRTEFNPDRPAPEGYFVKEGIAAGARIVTTAAGQLLARETNPSTEAE